MVDARGALRRRPAGRAAAAAETGIRTGAARRAVLVVAGVLAPALALAACTAPAVDPERARTVVVTVDAPLDSLNAGTAQGRTWGSTLVLSLVQDGFVALDDAGAAVFDTAFGTVEKVSDSPLTVRYTVGEDARWSDGTPVTPADLLLEWAARSGQFDEAAPEDVDSSGAATPSPTTGAASATPAAAATPTATATTPAPTASTPASTPSPTPTSSTPSDEPAVVFGGTSPVLLHASAMPTVDGRTLTLVYDEPVADWQVALDVGLPAHVVGRLALEDTTTPAPTPTTSGPTAAPTPTAEPTPTVSPGSSQAWADAVTQAVLTADRAALVAIAQVWRTGWDADAVAADPTRAVTTGPYRVASVVPGVRVELVRNDEYAGPRPAARDRIVVRSDLDPLAQVTALRDGEADVVAPLDTADVRAALTALPKAQVATGGGPVLALEVNPAGGGAFDPATYVTGTADGTAQAARVRAAFVAAVPRDALATASEVEPSGAVLAVVGPGLVTTPAVAATGAGAGLDEPVTVRILVNTGDPVRAAMLQALTEALAPDFLVQQAQVQDVATAQWDEPDAWDVALVPVSQAALPAEAASRWPEAGTGSAADEAGAQAGSEQPSGTAGGTDDAAAALAAARSAVASQIDPAALPAAFQDVAAGLRDTGLVVPLALQPSLAATLDRGEDSALPRVTGVTAVPWGRADLAPWWDWACTAS